HRWPRRTQSMARRVRVPPGRPAGGPRRRRSGVRRRTRLSRGDRVMDVPAQVDVEAEILRLSELAEKVTTLLAKRATESAEKDAAYRVAHAHAILRSKGTVAEREAQAAIDTEVSYLDRKLAEA